MSPDKARKPARPLVPKTKPKPRPKPELDADDRGVMTVIEVARCLLCHYSTVYRLAERSEIPCFKLGSSWRFLRSDIDRWIAKGGAAATVKGRT